MSRKLFALAVLLLAVMIGVLGFQTLQYLRVGHWPVVSLGFVWASLFGATPGVARWPWFDAAWRWLGGMPVTVVVAAAAYLVFLASDTLRLR